MRPQPVVVTRFYGGTAAYARLGSLLEEAKERMRGPFEPERVLADVVARAWPVWLAWGGGEAVGFAIAEERLETHGLPCLWLSWLYRRPGWPQAADALMGMLMRAAREGGLERVAFESDAIGMDRLADRWGFAPASTVYCLELAREV
jgi:hypothetical protein